MSGPKERVDAIGGTIETHTGSMWPSTDPAALKWPGEPEKVRAAYDEKLKGGKK